MCHIDRRLIFKCVATSCIRPSTDGVDRDVVNYFWFSIPGLMFYKFYIKEKRLEMIIVTQY